jgi:predicted dehydrogenase
MVSQSRRWNPQLFALREQAGRLGRVSTVTTEFFKAAHFPGFREEMAHPLLVDMAIHPFDSARFLMGAEPVSVYCEAYNPPWSWFAGAAAAAATFTMDSGARYVYTGSWCAPGAETSWNGSWRVSGEAGTALWSGDTAPSVHLDDGHAERMHRDDRDRLGDGVEAPVAVGRPNGIAWALQAFTAALRTGETPMGEVHENVMSLAMVEAAVESADRGQRVLVDDVLTQALERAVRDEQRTDVRDRLTSWPSVREVLVA